MFTAADIIEILGQRRRLKSIRPEVPGKLPPGWQSWLDAMPPAEGGVVGAQPQAFVDELAQRPLAQPPRRALQLNRWQAFATLWRQQWHAPVPEERGTRWFAAGFSGALHCVLIAMLLWLAYVRIEPPAPAAEGENVVQVEFIGRGTPREQGGGTPAGTQPELRPSTASSRAASAQPPVPAQEPAAMPPKTPPPQPAPEQEVARTEDAPAAQPEPPAPQPLQVTEVPQPDTDFVLPPPRPREVALPQREIVVPEVRQPTPRIAEVETPRQVAVEVERPQLRVQSTPRLRAAPEPTPESEASARMPQVRAREVRVTSATPELQVPAVRAQVREIPMPDLGTAPTPSQNGEAPAPANPAAANATATTAPGGLPAATTGTRQATTSGAGPVTAAKPGAWPSPERADDWGASTRNRPGGQPGGKQGEKPGLFNADGTPRLVDAPPPGGNAPGTVEQRIADLDRAGTWLKRPPYDYTPTAFDKYWRPRETLLQEWVRKGIKKLSIPIPGTDKKLECVVSLLQFGGGCGIADPNKNEQPASARPPPDIPFKPELQEDNGSVKP
jgi:hypothetical protein